MSLSDILLKVSLKFLERRNDFIEHMKIDKNTRNYLYIALNVEDKLRNIIFGIKDDQDRFHFDQVMSHIKYLFQTSLSYQEKINNITIFIKGNEDIINNYQIQTKDFLIFNLNIIYKSNFKFKPSDFKKIKERYDSSIINDENPDINLLLSHIFNILVDLFFIWDKNPVSYLEDIGLFDNIMSKYNITYDACLYHQYSIPWNSLCKYSTKDEYNICIDNMKELIQLLQKLKTKYKKDINHIHKNIKNLILENNKSNSIDLTDYTLPKLKIYCKDNNIVLDKSDSRIDIENKIKNYYSTLENI